MPQPRERRHVLRLAGASILLANFAMFAGCGYVGDPLPPALYIPLPVTDLTAMQVEDEVSIHFTLPQRTTEDLPVEDVAEVDLRMAEWENGPWDEGAWEREATRLSTLPIEGGPTEIKTVSARTPAGPWANKRVLIRARVAGKLGRLSAWSEPVALRVIPRPGSIRGFGVTSSPDGVRVFWGKPSAPASGMVTEIYRKPAAGDEFALLDAVPGDEWIDRTAQFGESYAYRIRERVQGDERNFMSNYLEALTITPIDTFAPSVPADVSAVAGATGVELSWTRNSESDFREYRVFRSVDGADFAMVGEPTSTPTFSDASAPTGVALRYRVTSVDQTGNESVPSSPVEITLP